jgi:hypothetical protein
MGRSWSIDLTLLYPDDILLPVENERITREGIWKYFSDMQAGMPALPGHFRGIRGL